jgi:ATP-dependent RNA helicase DHX8/PRP22
MLISLNRSEEDDPLSRCRAVVVDEAHTRAITTDVLLGILKRRIHQWPHLKVIVTSATINTAKMSAYLNNCPVIEIPGRLFPVDVVYKSPEGRSSIDAVVEMAIDICVSKDPGDVLCFLTGQSEVEWACQRFESAGIRNVRAFTLYGKQPPEEQSKVFLSLRPGQRKVIFSTDIAET